MVNIEILTNLLKKSTSYRIVPKNLITQEANDKIRNWCEKWGFFWDGEIIDVSSTSPTPLCQYTEVSVHEILPLISYLKANPTPASHVKKVVYYEIMGRQCEVLHENESLVIFRDCKGKLIITDKELQIIKIEE